MPSDEHRQSKYLNNRAENSNQGFRGVGAAQRFLSAFSGISPHFRPHRHVEAALDYRAEMTLRFTIWSRSAASLGQPTTA